MTAALQTLPKGKALKTEVPVHLIYEMYMGQPIYYRGYRDVLAGTKTFEQIYGRNTLQAYLKTQIALGKLTGIEMEGYEVFLCKMGIAFGPKDCRKSDIAIYKAGMELTVHHAKISPEIAIEIDVQAHTKDLGGEMKYITDKTNQYLQHGTKKVIWIFTNAGKVMEATQIDDFHISSWDKDLEIMEGVNINIAMMPSPRAITCTRLPPERRFMLAIP